MFNFATLPHLASRPISQPPPVARVDSPTAAVSQAARPASAEIRIRRLAESGAQEDSYAAILPQEGGTPIDLLRVITEACKDLPEFQIQNDEDERFILTLTLKS